MYQAGTVDGVISRPLKRHADSRGWLIELLRDDELPSDYRPAMSYASMTLPGVTRGPHDHRDQSDFFAFFGPGDFKLFLWDSRRDSPSYKCLQTMMVGESNPQAVLVPPGVVHAYKNIGAVPGLVFNAPNRLYAGWGRAEPVDEIRHEDEADSPYVID